MKCLDFTHNTDFSNMQRPVLISCLLVTSMLENRAFLALGRSGCWSGTGSFVEQLFGLVKNTLTESELAESILLTYHTIFLLFFLNVLIVKLYGGIQIYELIFGFYALKC